MAAWPPTTPVCSRWRFTFTASPSATPIAQDSGNRYTESLVADILSRVEAEHGDPLSALDTRAPMLRQRF
jgi:hypothetical protein